MFRYKLTKSKIFSRPDCLNAQLRSEGGARQRNKERYSVVFLTFIFSLRGRLVPRPISLPVPMVQSNYRLSNRVLPAHKQMVVPLLIVWKKKCVLVLLKQSVRHDF